MLPYALTLLANFCGDFLLCGCFPFDDYNCSLCLNNCQYKFLSEFDGAGANCELFNCAMIDCAQLNIMVGQGLRYIAYYCALL